MEPGQGTVSPGWDSWREALCDVDLWGDYYAPRRSSGQRRRETRTPVTSSICANARLSVVKPGEDLGYDFAQHMHDACWYVPGRVAIRSVHRLHRLNLAASAPGSWSTSNAENHGGCGIGFAQKSLRGHSGIMAGKTRVFRELCSPRLKGGTGTYPDFLRKIPRHRTRQSTASLTRIRSSNQLTYQKDPFSQSDLCLNAFYCSGGS